VTTPITTLACRGLNHLLTGTEIWMALMLDGSISDGTIYDLVNWSGFEQKGRWPGQREGVSNRTKDQVANAHPGLRAGSRGDNSRFIPSIIPPAIIPRSDRHKPMCCFGF
jgi:hypothetical protein